MVEAEVKMHESIRLPEPVTLVGEIVHEVLLLVTFTTPAKPLAGTTVIVDGPTLPTFKVTDVGLEVMEKSVTVNVIVAE